TTDQQQVRVLARVDGVVVVAVDRLELPAQARLQPLAGIPARDGGLRRPTLVELRPRQHAVAVGVPARERGRGCLVRLLGARGRRCEQHRRGGDPEGDAAAHVEASCGIADSKVISSRISAVRRPIIIGLRTFGRKLMSNSSVMSPSKRIQFSTSPLVSETICTPHHGSASRLRSSSSSCRPSKRWLRGLESPTAATLPTIDSPRRKPGQNASGTKAFFSKSTQPRCPVPALSTHSLPFAQRGECGIDRPSQTISSVSTSMTTPPSWRRSRQPSTASLRQTAVTYLGRPSTIARP